MLPADYVLRAIPLEAGDHSIRLEYRSPAFTIGKWVSLLSLIAYGVAIAVALGFVPARLRTKLGAALATNLRPLQRLGGGGPSSRRRSSSES